jgi:uncharacterized protein YraI
MFDKRVIAAAAFITLALSGAAYADSVRVNPYSDALDYGFLNMRSGPGQGHGVILSIPAGAYVEVVGPCITADDGTSVHRWCNIKWGGRAGWASSGGLEVRD